MGAYLGALEARLAGDRVRRHAVERRPALRRRREGRRPCARSSRDRRPASVGARAVAEAAGHPRVIGFDMGGTSTDVCLIDGAIPTTTDTMVGDFPVRLPVIDIHTVGAGGGSIAYVDSGGALRVGPRSAGADAGTGLLRQRHRADGHRRQPAARPARSRAVPRRPHGARRRARPRASPPTWRGASASTSRRWPRASSASPTPTWSARSASSRSSAAHDPRDFALLAFGGAGGMHACAIAETLDIATVIVPRHAGVLSALGMLLADAIKDYCADDPAGRRRDRRRRARRAVRAAGRGRASATWRAKASPPDRIHVERRLDVRYAGQSYELAVPMAPGFRDEFDRRHARTYGYADPRRAIEVVTLRVVAVGPHRQAGAAARRGAAVDRRAVPRRRGALRRRAGRDRVLPVATIWRRARPPTGPR